MKLSHFRTVSFTGAAVTHMILSVSYQYHIINIISIINIIRVNITCIAGNLIAVVLLLLC